MALCQAIDDNGEGITSVASLRPDFAHACNATTGAGIAELDISSLNIAANRNGSNNLILMVVAVGNACYFSLGAAATAPANQATMMLVPAGSPVFVKALSTDVSAYHLQLTGAATLKVVALV